MKKPELLAPAGNFEKLRTAIHYGADAVYLGGQKYSLRAHATNFTDQEIARGVAYAHERGVKVYVTVNILAHNRDLDTLPEYLETLARNGVDGLIVSDPGILRIAKKHVPSLPVHLSTQANVTNLESARFWEDQGVKRINAARELSLAEIVKIREATDLEVEVFVHGALCISYSGRCLLSSYLTGRSANQGDCAHPCRYSYALTEEKRPGQYFPVEEDERGTYIFNSKDLCLLQRLPELMKSGVDSLKIEGRMKSVYYTGAVVRTYRAALDHLADLWPTVETGALPKLEERFMTELHKIGSRGYTENFFDEPPGPGDMLHNEPRITPSHEPAGIVRVENDRVRIEIRSPLFPGDSVEYLGKGLESTSHMVHKIFNEDGEELEKANPGNLVTLEIGLTEVRWQDGALLRKKAGH
ncbi:MAG: U32 family peptidase [Proteobacteria bacterium]|nr:U32 family peptidase [Pseudomonadota bacterium]MBU1739873.1 U32 family peptidase [Pseudomonadota bacterium]